MSGLNIQPTTQEERAQMFLQMLLNNTNKVTKISDQSVLNAHAQSIAKIAGKSEKDIVLALSTFYPDNTYGENLDNIANILGIAPRFGASGSSMFVRVVGNLGTTYIQGIHVFSGKDNIQFELEESVTIGSAGFSYAKVRSIDVGDITNVNPVSINKVSPQPVGHVYCVNEYKATGGRDNEDDVLFRRRIKEGANILATGTIAALEQAFMKINNNVLKIFFQGINDQSQIVIAICTQNGVNLNQAELDELLDRGENYFSFTQLKPHGRTSYGVYLKNIEWQYIDISFRCQLLPSYNQDAIRKEIQIGISKYLDHRYWKAGTQNVEWDTLLEIVKNTKGVKYVPDQYFYPAVDLATDKNKLPRLRGFLMLSLQGVLMESLNGVLSPTYYPNEADFSFQQTVLRNI